LFREFWGTQYNESLISTRNVVERQYGVWKGRFPILQLGMRLKLNTVFAVIISTAVIHNLAIEENEDIPEEWLEDIDEEEDVFAPQQNNVHLLRIIF
jgi:hypothetical protein